MPFVLGFVGLAAFCVALFVVVSRKNVALACGEHASISTNSNIKKAGISVLAALLIVGSCASFTKAFADTLDESKLTGEVTVNLNSDYSLNSIHYRINNQTGVDLTGKGVRLLGGSIGYDPENPEDGFTGFYSAQGYGGDQISLEMNDFMFKADTITEYTAKASDLEDISKSGFIAGGQGIFYTLDGLPVTQKIIDELKASGTSETLNNAFYMELSYDAWNIMVYANKEGESGWGYLGEIGCFKNTIQDYDLLVSLVNNSNIFSMTDYENYEFVGFINGTGETVDAAYLASHPITADTIFYAILKEKSASNDSPSADNSAEPGTPGDVTDTPEVTDSDAVNAEADVNKDNAEAADPSQDVEGTKEGDQAEQTA